MIMAPSTVPGSAPRRRAMRLLACALGLGLCASGAIGAEADIQPISDGTFSDPYIVPFNGLYISGTEQRYLVCLGHLTRNCGQPQKIVVDTSNLEARAKALNLYFTLAGLHPFKNDNGLWMMALTLHVHRIGDKDDEQDNQNGIKGWSVIAHAAPDVQSDFPPQKWHTTDQLLVGSFQNNVKANYDGKYFQDNGQLWLIYQKRINDTPKRDGIVAQKMISPTQPAAEGPQILLRPSNDDEAKKSELYDPGSGDGLKLVETGNIYKINGKYVMAYSVGNYNTRYYKIGIAYCDTFLPKTGTYRKVTHADKQGVWEENGGKDNREIYYLLQSQKPDWPNYVGNQVLAPGVPNLTRNGPDGSWAVVFAGHRPSDANEEGPLVGADRRPYFAKIKVNIPGPETKVSQVDEETLGNWIQLVQ